MKTRIKKTIIVVAALLFVGSGVAFAHDRDYRPPGKTHGHYKEKKRHSGRYSKHFKPKRHDRGRQFHKEVHHHYHYYENHHHRWNKKHVNPVNHHRKGYIYKEVHHHHHFKKHHRRPPRHEDVIYKAALKGSKVIFKVIVKDHGLF